MAAIYFLAKRGTPAARFPYAWISSESAEFATMVETVIEAGDFTFAAENGTVGAPSFTFSSDTNTGLYRVGSDNLGITAGGSLIAEFYTSGATQYFSVSADYSYMLAQTRFAGFQGNCPNPPCVPAKLFQIGIRQSSSPSLFGLSLGRRCWEPTVRYYHLNPFFRGLLAPFENPL